MEWGIKADWMFFLVFEDLANDLIEPAEKQLIKLNANPYDHR